MSDVTTTPSAGGWLVACGPCRWEVFAPRIKAADKARHEHEAWHAKRGK